MERREILNNVLMGVNRQRLNDNFTELYDNDIALETKIDEVKETADGAYVKPDGGIPASDLASGVIPDVSEFVNQGDIDTAVSGHNEDEDAHIDILTELRDNISAIGAGVAENVADIENIQDNLLGIRERVDVLEDEMRESIDKHNELVTGHFELLDGYNDLVGKHNALAGDHNKLRDEVADISDILPQKMDKVIGAVRGNIAVFDRFGNVRDCGYNFGGLVDLLAEVMGITLRPPRLFLGEAGGVMTAESGAVLVTER